MYAVTPLRQPEQLGQVALGFEVGEELADALQALQAVDILEQVGLAAHDQALPAVECTGPRGKPRLDDLLCQGIEFCLGGRVLLLNSGLGLVQGQPTDARIEVVGSFDEA